MSNEARPMAAVLTAQAQALRLALDEAGKPRILRALGPGVALCEGVSRPPKPVFLRHLCPAEVTIPLNGSRGDLFALQQGLSGLLPRLDPAQSFSIQTRVLDGFRPAYKPFDVNALLARAAGETGAALDVKAPGQVVSVTLAAGTGWLGLSPAEENLSGWAGGCRRFKWEEGLISRAAFKLLEALEVFRIPLPSAGRALDLGAAPGGWTAVLRSRGLSVTAVDPAVLDPRVSADPGVAHFRGTAQAYFHEPEPCDLLVNDMRMDSQASAALMAQAAPCLAPGGHAILTLKLPDDPGQWRRRAAQARTLLAEAFSVAAMRQLFHNRSEVTVHLRRRGRS